jgi:Asp-tRNA(Asn)/Glu-tRNA(Gln) amidotransferase A subunit family amidase
MAQNIAAADAPSVERNVAAGACIIGKTTTTEFGCRGGGPSPLTGITRTDPIDWWMAEFYAGVGTRLKSTMRESRQLLDPAVALMLEPALKQSLEDCYDEVFRRYEYRERMRARFENIDLLITPATPCSAFGADEDSPAGFGDNINQIESNAATLAHKLIR